MPLGGISVDDDDEPASERGQRAACDDISSAEAATRRQPGIPNMKPPIAKTGQALDGGRVATCVHPGPI
jgi:hypothetical protein